MLNKKVLLKLSSTLKLRNFDIGMKIVAEHYIFGVYSPHLALHILRCGCCCFIRINGNAKTRV